MKTDYSPKETVIFGGVLKLARQGADITKITSRQIASAAGMGKATIYDYFSTKEEIIYGALAWSMSRQRAEFSAAMDRMPDFETKMHTIYGGIIERVADTGSIFHLLLQVTGGRKQGYFTDSTACTPIHSQLKEFTQILYNVLYRGYTQGVLKTDVSRPQNTGYVRMVFISTVFAVASRADDRQHPQPPQTIIENAYKMLVKALG